MDKHNPLQNLAYTLARHIPLAGAVTAGVALSVALGASQFAAWAADGLLHNIRFDQGSRHFVIDTTGPVKAVVNTLTIAGRKRVIIDLDNADIGGDLPRDAQLLQDLTAQMPTLKNVTVNQYGGNGRPIVRVLLDLQGDPGAVRLLRNQGPHIELEISDYAGSSPTTGYPGAPIYQGDNSGNSSSYGGGGYSSQPSTGSRYGSSTPTIDSSGYPSSERSMSSRISASQSNNQTGNQASGPQLEDMKRTLVVMNQRYDQLAQENTRLKNSLAASQSAAQTATSNSGELSRLQSQISQLNTQNSDLTTQIQTLTSRNTEIQTRLSQALASANAARNSLSTSTAQQAQLDEARKKVADLSNQLDMLRQDHRLQSQQVEQLILDKATLNNQISQLKTQVASKSAAPSQPNISDSELQELRRQLSTAQQAMNDSLKTIREQNQEMAYLRNQINTVKSGMDAAAKEQIGSLQSANETKDKTIADLRQQLEKEKTGNSATQIAGIKNQMNSLQSQNESNNRTHQVEIQDLNKQLLDKNNQIAALHQQLDDVVDRQNNHPTTADLRQKDARISELEKAVFKANQQVLASQTTLRQLDDAKAQIAQLKANEEQRQVAERELGTTKAQLARYETAQKQLEAAQVDLRITKAQLAQMQSDESQLKAARQDLITLKAELDKVKTQSVSNGKSNSSQQAALTSLTQNNQKLSQQLEQVNAQLKTAQQQLASRPATDNSAQINQLQKQVDDLNQQLQQANTQLKAAQSKTTTASSGKTTPANNLQVIQLQKQIGDLNQQLASMRSENVELRNSASKPSGPGGNNPDAETAYQEAKTAQKAKRIPDSLDKFKAALLLDPNNSRYAIDYSVALGEDQQYAEAIDVLRRYLQHNPADREAYNQLGKIYLLNDQPDAANQSFVRAIPVSTINNYATSLKKLGKLDDAEKMFKLALSLNPKDSEVLFNLGNLYNNQNKLDQARNKYLEAIQIRPDFAEAHYNLGLIFSKLGDNPKAIEHLEMFLRLSPNARNAETIRAYVQKLKA